MSEIVAQRFMASTQTMPGYRNASPLYIDPANFDHRQSAPRLPALSRRQLFCRRPPCEFCLLESLSGKCLPGKLDQHTSGIRVRFAPDIFHALL
jgi:hypothetical protein